MGRCTKMASRVRKFSNGLMYSAGGASTDHGRLQRMGSVARTLSGSSSGHRIRTLLSRVSTPGTPYTLDEYSSI
eukprot:2517459-Prymnesium_polylepis.2